MFTRIVLLAAMIAAPIGMGSSRALGQTKPSSQPDLISSVDELRGVFDEGRYQEVVKQAAKIFALRGEAARLYDRHDVTSLKAESHLRLGQTALAIDGFESAGAIAPNPQTAAIDRATVLLIKQSTRSGYTPRSPAPHDSGKPIDILEPASRKLAFRAMFTDELDDAKVQIDKARESDQLRPTLDAVEQTARLRMIEQAAENSDTESGKLLKPLSKRAKSMMGDEIKSCEKRVAQIEKAANKKKKVASTYRKQGLSQTDPDDLRDVAKTCRQIVEASVQLAQSIPEDKGDYDEIRLDAQRAGKHAEEVLGADYTGNFDRS